MNKKRLALAALLTVFSALLFAGCAAQPETISKGEAFPLLYEEKPGVILVLPPINETTAADAKDFYLVTLARPLSLMGYYVLPIEITNEMFKAYGVYDTETMIKTRGSDFKKLFGADALLFIRLMKWDTAYYIIGGHVTVALELAMVSTATGRELWRYQGEFLLDTSESPGQNSGVAGLILAIVATAVKTAAADYVPVADRLNAIVISTVPMGKYQEKHQQDKDARIIKKPAPVTGN